LGGKNILSKKTFRGGERDMAVHLTHQTSASKEKKKKVALCRKGENLELVVPGAKRVELMKGLEER